MPDAGRKLSGCDKIALAAVKEEGGGEDDDFEMKSEK